MPSDTPHTPPAPGPPPATPALTAPPTTGPPPNTHSPASTIAPPISSLSRRLLRLVRWGIWCTAAGTAIFAAYYFGDPWWTYRRCHSITEDAFLEAHIVNIAPEMVSGRVVRLLVEENDRVEQGQVLAEIEPVHYRDQVEQARGKLDLAEAELKRQEAGLAKLKKEVPLQVEVAKQTLVGAQIEEARAKAALTLTTDEVQKTIDESKAAVEVAKANHTLAKQEFDRWTELAAQAATTKRKAEEVTRAYDSAKAELTLADVRLAKSEAARTKIELAKRDLEVAQAGVVKARRAVDLGETGYDQIRETELMVDVKKEMVKDAQIALTSAQHQLQFTQIRAPFPGVVVKRYRNLGDFASPGVAVLSMYNADQLYVTANLEETRLPGVAPGNQVELNFDAFDKPFRGRVVWINKSTGAQFALMPRNVVSGEFTKVVQRVPVRIAIEKDERWPLLRAGLSVQVIIDHGNGDLPWAAHAARSIQDEESRFNQPEQPAHAVGPGNWP